MYPLADRLVSSPALWGCAAAFTAALIVWARRSRDGVPVPVWLLDDAGDVAGHGLVLDRSARGLRLAVDEPLPVGTVLRVSPLDPPAGTAPVVAEVRWCRRGGPRTEVGCRFTEPPAADVLGLFG
jgi:hypothetical protein